MSQEQVPSVEHQDEATVELISAAEAKRNEVAAVQHYIHRATSISLCSALVVVIGKMVHDRVTNGVMGDPITYLATAGAVLGLSRGFVDLMFNPGPSRIQPKT